jgi:hypothetical protein
MDDGEAGRRICGRAERFSEEARDVVSDGSSSRAGAAGGRAPTKSLVNYITLYLINQIKHVISFSLFLRIQATFINHIQWDYKIVRPLLLH